VRGVERRRRGPFVEFRGEGDSGERKRTSGIHGGGGGASVRARATGATAGCRARAGRWRGGARPRGHRPSRRRTRRHRLQQRLLAAAGVRQRAGVVHAPVGRRRCLRVQTLQASQQRADLALHQVQLGPCQRPSGRGWAPPGEIPITSNRPLWDRAYAARPIGDARPTPKWPSPGSPASHGEGNPVAQATHPKTGDPYGFTRRGGPKAPGDDSGGMTR
jgi:hypothetical protein